MMIIYLVMTLITSEIGFLGITTVFHPIQTKFVYLLICVLGSDQLIFIYLSYLELSNVILLMERKRTLIRLFDLSDLGFDCLQ